MIIDKIKKNYEFWNKIKFQLENVDIEYLLSELLDFRFD